MVRRRGNGMKGSPQSEKSLLNGMREPSKSNSTITCRPVSPVSYFSQFVCAIHNSKPVWSSSCSLFGSKNIQAKLVLLGEMGTGKTSLVLRFVKGLFSDYQEPTIGAAFFTQVLSLNEATVKFDIWDTAGQERYHSLAPMYYRGAAAAVVVYDITSMESFEKAKKWVEELQRQGNPDMFMMLVGNKADLDTKRKVENEVGENYAKENGLHFFESLAKTAQNVNELFYEAAKTLAAKAPPSGPSGMKLQSRTQDGRRTLFCCPG
ncbi:hypothetical protein Nepgr_025647 [Nepenthes gracilis]|uniref:Ras-related protein RHN1 n=1 Tax=Nepenthes gracilis TaxID=150966 RepID=A0AAD3Y198_NEPGR|nr:hypothetical protein Nepgr_025647 [Nepenthes gracilis]